MENVKLNVVKNILTIKVDLSKTGGPSASGKTLRVASTLGNKEVPGGNGAILGLNVYHYANPK